MITVNNDWQEFLDNEAKKEYFKSLMDFIEEDSKDHNIFPKEEDRFNAFSLTPYSRVKAVVIGQDPYHGENQAHGLAFSVKKGEKIPPSLRNIYKELEEELGIERPPHGNLEEWAKEGILLLNAVMTVRKGEAASHRNKGWETFTDNVIKYLNEHKKPLVFFLWGSDAQKKEALITNKSHLILKSVHPSPLSASRGFFGCGHFLKCKEFLAKNNIDIDFHIEGE